MDWLIDWLTDWLTTDAEVVSVWHTKFHVKKAEKAKLLSRRITPGVKLLSYSVEDDNCTSVLRLNKNPDYYAIVLLRVQGLQR